eukprot:TRINITY_DN4210_c0_g2_i2.p2 TRINITY_DN4210_c0_g2~~TRINITY_DN4210_c0_g2_i2.p2  ORF type:complete len:103 (-),score=1.06 TRINITY_DN4210_c0_g2_i2:239-547(-)
MSSTSLTNRSLSRWLYLKTKPLQFVGNVLKPFVQLNQQLCFTEYLLVKIQVLQKHSKMFKVWFRLLQFVFINSMNVQDFDTIEVVQGQFRDGSQEVGGGCRG